MSKGRYILAGTPSQAILAGRDISRGVELAYNAGSMNHYVIVATFDAETEATLRDITRELSQALDLENVSSNPHITLVSGPWDEAPALSSAIKDMADENMTIEINMPAAGMFLSNAGIRFLAPTFTTPLLQLREQALALVTEAGLTVDPYWQPGQWLPHCSLLRGVKGEHLLDAAETLQKHTFPIAERIAFLELVWMKSESPEALGRWSLAG